MSQAARNGSLRVRGRGLVLFVSFAITGAYLWGPSVWAAQPDFKPGKARWSIKTSVPTDADPNDPWEVDLADLPNVNPPYKWNDSRFREARIPWDTPHGIREGEMVGVEGWLHERRGQVVG